MKHRMFALLNFLALNILFFAIYLNFIHKDTTMLPPVAASASIVKTVASNDVKSLAHAEPEKIQPAGK
jgi:hypothetical protein